mgnify:CR=1 FL=1
MEARGGCLLPPPCPLEGGQTPLHFLSFSFSHASLSLSSLLFFLRKWPGEFKYEAGAAKGHLPLTNALRGTQLFEAILEHPAFASAPASAGGEGGGEGGGSKGPAWL